MSVPIGIASGIISFVTTPLFLATNIMSLKDHMPKVPAAGVRIFAGLGDLHDPLGGREPSVAFWNVNGQYLGNSHKSKKTIRQGNYVDVSVKFGGSNEPPDYMAVAAQTKDAICISGLFIKWPEGSGQAIMLGNLGAMCGMPWYPSRVRLTIDQEETPTCMWIDGSGKSKNRLTHPASSGNVADPPAGFSVHLSDVTGPNVNHYTAEQHNKHPDFMCSHEARWKLWDDMRGKFRIPIFAEKPLKLGENGTDPDDFMSKAIELSEPLRNYITGKRDLTDSDEAAADRKHLLLHRSLVKSNFSAKELCGSASSWGPDFYSHTENQLCHMASKTLVPACSAQVTDECFDPEMNEIKLRSQGVAGRVRPREVAVPAKRYAQIEDHKDPNVKLLF